MTRTASILTLFIACLVTSWPAPAVPPLTEFRVYIPAFAGQSGLGQNVATILNLGIWRTLRKRPTPNPDNLDFGSATVIWSDEPLPATDLHAAIQALVANRADMILWGLTGSFAEGAAVQAYLLVNPEEKPDAQLRAVWRIERNGHTIQLGLPRHLFEFGIVVVGPEVVARYSSPSALRLCPERDDACTGGQPLGDSQYRALEHHQDWTLVTNEVGQRGWIHFPELRNASNEIVAFTGGLTAYHRGDFSTAARLFRETAGIDVADALVREDALTLQAAALSRRLHSANEAAQLIDQILETNPYSRFAVQVRVMDAIEHYDPNVPASVDRLRTVAANLRANPEMFELEDPWRSAAEQVFSALEI
jgi:hypothetical protein